MITDNFFFKYLNLLYHNNLLASEKTKCVNLYFFGRQLQVLTLSKFALNAHHLSFPPLFQIKIEKNKMSKVTVEEIKKQLDSGAQSLKFKNVDLEGAKVIGEALKTNTSLTQLDLRAMKLK